MQSMVLIKKKDLFKLLDSMMDDDDMCPILVSDLDKGIFICKKVMKYSKCKDLINESKSLIFNTDDDEDAFQMVSLYSEFQNNPYAIKARGIKQDILLM